MLNERHLERWAILIDMEGFSELWHKEDQVLWSLGELMRSIFRIGRICFPDSPERLFAHQISDGFLVVSDFGEENLERAITIAVALMQHVAATGRLCEEKRYYENEILPDDNIAYSSDLPSLCGVL